jgi:type IV pilus assembly protein PilY1
MKRSLLFALALVLIFSSQLWADDTEIYGAATISITPNILIIFDTSGSMSTVDVPGSYYTPATTYAGSYTNNSVYRKVCDWGCHYELFASDINNLNCPDVKTALETYGYDLNASIKDSGSGFTCEGTDKDLYLGNWINYDENYSSGLRSRTAVAKEVITTVINDTDNVRFGLMRFNNNSGDDQGGYIISPCGTDKVTLINQLNSLPASGYTPLGETLAEAGLYFAGKTSWYNGSSGSYDSTCDSNGTGCIQYTSPMQYRCQKNYVILMTDGASTQDISSKLSSGTYINGDTIGDYDNDGNDPGSYGSDGSDYLDDVAKYLYENDLNSSLGTSGDSFEKQNIITYTIGFQTDQPLLSETAYRGGGLYYTANSISGLTAAFEKIMADIADVNAVYVSPVVPVSRMNRTFAGNSLYVGFFKPQTDGRWAGNIKKYGLDDQGTIIDANGNRATLLNGAIKDNARSFWSVSIDGPNVLEGGIGAILLDQATRNLYTYMGTAASLIDSSNAFSTSNTDIIPSTLGVFTETEKDDVINDIHGVGRDWILGDILHSKPSVAHYDTNSDGTIDESFIFSGNNDGIMHCFKDSDGSEVWGFIPQDHLTRLKLLSDAITDHDYFVDGAPVIYQDAGQKILLFGERRGGSDYYALDVTTYNEPTYLYKIESDFLAGVDGINATLGQSWSTPTVHEIKTAGGSDTVFLLAGGYDTNQDNSTPGGSDAVGRAAFTIKVSDGTLSSLNVNAGNYADMTHCFVDVAGFDTTGNGFTNRVYAGDLGGDIFAFEDDDEDGTWSNRKLFSASADDGVQRKIFYSPDAVAESFGGTIGEMVFFGTGDRADPEKTTVVNRIYAVKNTWDALPITTLTESDLTDVTADLIVLGTDEEKIQARDALLNSKGWYIRLENPGEKVTSSITVFNGVVYFTTYTPESGGGGGGGDPCVVVSGRGDARFYALNYKTGEAAFEYSEETETDGEGNTVTQGKKDRNQVIGTSIASAPVIAVFKDGPQIYIGVEGGVLTENPGATVALNSFYWRQIND